CNVGRSVSKSTTDLDLTPRWFSPLGLFIGCFMAKKKSIKPVRDRGYDKEYRTYLTSFIKNN
ncbi:hypothetical protein, partial [Rodentibacter pneumotropicus]|uniref:hypothetical protein n=1 Tax=Rodentibacter pneumotropicus TaxID=758 RepID=UPI0026753FC2